mgnify:CR=1 FL=1
MEYRNYNKWRIAGYWICLAYPLFCYEYIQINRKFRDFQRPEYALKHFIRFLAAKVAITYALDIMTVIYKICGGVVEKLQAALAV